MRSGTGLRRTDSAPSLITAPLPPAQVDGDVYDTNMLRAGGGVSDGEVSQLFANRGTGNDITLDTDGESSSAPT